MKKYIFLLLFILSNILNAKNVIGYINYLTEEDIKEISINEDPNIYLEEKYKGRYYAKIEKEFIRIYPRLYNVEFEKNVYEKENLSNVVPSIKIGDVIEDDRYIMSSLNNEILKDNYLFDIDYIYEINDEGKMILKVINKSQKENFINFGIEIKKDRAITNFKFSRNNIFSNDLLNMNALVSIKDYNSILNINYNVFDFLGNKLKTYVGYDSDNGFNFGSEYTRYFVLENNKMNPHVLKPKIGLNYSYKNQSKFNIETGINYKKIFENGFIIDTTTSLGYNIFKNINDNYFTLKNETNLKWSFLNSKNNFNFTLSKISKKNKFKSKEGRTSNMNEFLGQYLISSENEITTLDIFDMRTYIFADLLLSGDYLEKTVVNSGTGIGLIYNISPIKFEGYIGINFDTIKKLGFVGGLSLEFDI